MGEGLHHPRDAAAIGRRRLLCAAAAGACGFAAAPDARSQAWLSPAVTAPLAAFIRGATGRSWPEEIVELAKRHLLDTLAAQVACRDLDPAVLARRYVLSAAWARGAEARLIGGRERASVLGAAFANAMTGHAAEINDFSPSAFVQPGPSVVSVCLALAEARRLSGRAVLGAIILGYELACRMPKALGVRNLRRAGLANHAIGPAFGCGAAAAALLGLSPAQIAAMLSYCAEQASGSWQWLLDSSHVEKAFVFAGMPARNGLEAALMAQAGFSGVTDALDRPGGWLDSGVFKGPDSDLNRGYLTEGLGEHFELPLVGYKRFPTGGPTQPAVQAMLALAPKVGRRRALAVKVEMPGDATAFSTAEMPALNIRYLMAIILVDGRLDFAAAQSKRRMADDAAIRALMAKVEVVADPSQERTPRVESARVSVRLGDETLSEFVPQVAGFPGRPLTREEVVQKALDLMAPRLGAARALSVCNAALTLEKSPTMTGLLNAVTPQR